MAELRPQEIFATLERHEVRYVLVGGVAAILHGAPHVTTDVDVVPEEGRDNLERLSAALKELNARIRIAGEPQGVPFDHSAESLSRVRIWNLVTDHGDLDITFVPSGTRGYDDLIRDARRIPVRGIDEPALARDAIRSKACGESTCAAVSAATRGDGASGQRGCPPGGDVRIAVPATSCTAPGSSEVLADPVRGSLPSRPPLLDRQSPD
jgi:hypothetical protein